MARSLLVLPAILHLIPAVVLASAPALEVRVAAGVDTVDLSVKKRKARALLTEPGEALELKATGPGMLFVAVYQVVGNGAAMVSTAIDGRPDGGLAVKGAAHKAAK